jgi:hypothetical protein
LLEKKKHHPHRFKANLSHTKKVSFIIGKQGRILLFLLPRPLLYYFDKSTSRPLNESVPFSYSREIYYQFILTSSKPWVLNPTQHFSNFFLKRNLKFLWSFKALCFNQGLVFFFISIEIYKKLSMTISFIYWNIDIPLSTRENNQVLIWL